MDELYVHTTMLMLESAPEPRYLVFNQPVCACMHLGSPGVGHYNWLASNSCENAAQGMLATLLIHCWYCNNVGCMVRNL